MGVLVGICLSLVLGQIPDPLQPPDSIPRKVSEFSESNVDPQNGDSALIKPETKGDEELPASVSTHPFLLRLFHPDRKPWEDSDWKKVPVVQTFPHPEYWGPTPTGPGYYSLLDLVQNRYREKPPKFPLPRVAPMPPSFFDVDWRYLDDPDLPDIEKDWLDFFKRRHPTPDTMFSMGGEIRLQIQNIVSQFFKEFDENFLLHRVRLYGDFWYQDRFRIYLEFLNAGQSWENVPTIFPDIENGDFLNAFVELLLGDFREAPIYVRAGRQELLYGSQRLISTLDWSNTRRTFQGVKVYQKGKEWDNDLFWVQPVIVDQGDLNSVDEAIGFGGYWNTWRPNPHFTSDLYVLNLNNSDLTAEGRDRIKGSRNITTGGTRVSVDYEGLLFEAEGMLQVGRWSNQDFAAGATAIGGGYASRGLPGIPTLQVHYDYASGSKDPFHGSGNSTFQQLYPFGHYYLGFLDLVGRQNIHDISVQFSWNATNWIQFAAQTHRFYLDTPEDALYAANGRKLRQDPTGQAGRDVGTELDLTTSFHLSNHQDLLLGWSQIWSGEFIRKTGPMTNPQFFYTQYAYRW